MSVTVSRRPKKPARFSISTPDGNSVSIEGTGVFVGTVLDELAACPTFVELLKEGLEGISADELAGLMLEGLKEAA